MTYLIMYRGEEVDSFESRPEAESMLREYNLAFNGGCSIRESGL